MRGREESERRRRSEREKRGRDRGWRERLRGGVGWRREDGRGRGGVLKLCCTASKLAFQHFENMIKIIAFLLSLK